MKEESSLDYHFLENTSSFTKIEYHFSLVAILLIAGEVIFHILFRTVPMDIWEHSYSVFSVFINLANFYLLWYVNLFAFQVLKSNALVIPTYTMIGLLTLMVGQGFLGNLYGLTEMQILSAALRIANFGVKTWLIVAIFRLPDHRTKKYFRFYAISMILSAGLIVVASLIFYFIIPKTLEYETIEVLRNSLISFFEMLPDFAILYLILKSPEAGIINRHKIPLSL